MHIALLLNPRALTRPICRVASGQNKQRTPDVASALTELGREIACHGWRWINYQRVDEVTERERMRLGLGLVAIKQLTGTRCLVAEDGALTFESDYSGDFFICLRNSFGALYAEGDRNGLNAPKMLGVGMHCRLPGRPGRFVGLQRFLHHVAQHDKVRICKRVDIARFWKTTHPFIA